MSDILDINSFTMEVKKKILPILSSFFENKFGSHLKAEEFLKTKTNDSYQQINDIRFQIRILQENWKHQPDIKIWLESSLKDFLHPIAHSGMIF